MESIFQSRFPGDDICDVCSDNLFHRSLAIDIPEDFEEVCSFYAKISLTPKMTK